MVVVCAVLAPWIAPYDPHEQVGPVFGHPSWSHPLGLDDGGIDMLSLLMWGCRISLVVGFAATFVSMVIGGTIGVAAGYFGGRTDNVLMRITDYFLVIPDVPLMIVVAAIWGPSLFHIVIVIGILLWTSTARVIRAQVKSVRERVYVKRARALGAGHTRIVVRHVLPQVAPLLIANTVLTIAVAIFDETALAFLGLGDPNSVSLGKIIENAFQRSAISADSSGSAETSPSIRPGVTVRPDVASSSGTRYGGSSTGCEGSGISGVVCRTATMRLAPTNERVILSAVSTAVRIGTTRKNA